MSDKIVATVAEYVGVSGKAKQPLLFEEIDFYCPDQADCARLSKVLAFLGGLHPRLGQQSPVRMLTDLPLQLIAKKALTKGRVTDPED